MPKMLSKACLLAAVLMLGEGARASTIYIPPSAAQLPLGAGLQVNGATVATTGGRDTRVTVAATLALANSDCGTHVQGNGLVLNTVTLPAAPPAGCTFTLEPVLFSMSVAFNGQILFMPGFGHHPIEQLMLPYSQKDEYLTLVFDGTNWGVADYSRTMEEGLSPLSDTIITNGQVYFAADALNGDFQLCPYNGPGGLIVAQQMHQIPSACLKFARAGTTSSALNYFYVDNTGATAVTGAANNGSGLIRLAIASTFNAGDQVAMNCYSILGTTEANGRWAGAVVDSAHVDLVGSTFVNTYVTNADARCRVDGLRASTTGHATDTQSGVEALSSDPSQTLVGMAWIDAANTIVDTLTRRDSASWYNPRERTCQNKYTADRTTTSTSYAEVNSEIECEFVTFLRTSGGGMANNARDDKLWSITGAMSNGTAADGAAVTAGFGGTTPETEQSAYKNGTSVLTVPAALRGSKLGLTEGKHFITLLAKALTGGTVTLLGTTPDTSIEINLYQ